MQAKIKARVENLGFVVLLGLLILGGTLLVRQGFGKPPLYGQEGFYNLHLAAMAHTKGLWFNDPLVSPKVYVQATPYHLLLGVLWLDYGAVACIVFQVVMGLLFIDGFWALWLGWGKRLAFVSTFVLGLSPGFLLIFTAPSSEALSLMLIVWGIFFWVKKGTRTQTLMGLVLLALTATTGFWWALAVLTIVLGHSLLFKPRPFSVVFLLGVFACAFHWLGYSVGLGSFTSILNHAVFELRELGTLSIGCAIFGSIGVFEALKKTRGLSAVFAILAIASAVQTHGAMLLLVFPPLTGFMLLRLFGRDWVLRAMKYSTYLLTFLILVFSTAIAGYHIVNDTPDNSEFEALKVLKQLNSSGVVFTEPGLGYEVQAIAEKPTLCYSCPGLDNKTHTILTSQSLKRTLPLLEEYNISLLFITGRMKRSLWQGNDTGLLFLLRNNETFKRVYEVNGNQIWKVLR